MRPVVFGLLGAVLALGGLGCGGNRQEGPPKVDREAPQAAAHAGGYARTPVEWNDGTKFAISGGGGGMPAAVKPAAAAAGQAAPARPVSRKIVFTGQVEVVADNFDQAAEELTQLVQAQQGYVAKSELRGSTGESRTGLWTLRVPADHFPALLEALARLGEQRNRRIDSDDITDRYYDTQAHVKNDQVEEEGLRKLYLEKSATGKLDDLLAIRRELRAIRGEIERQQGQLQRWDKETQFSTITATVYERKGYVPPTAPTFAASVGHTFWTSIDVLVGAGRFLALVAVALAPWLPLIALLIVAVALAVRRARRRPRPAAAVAPAPGPG